MSTPLPKSSECWNSSHRSCPVPEQSRLPDRAGIRRTRKSYLISEKSECHEKMTKKNELGEENPTERQHCCEKFDEGEDVKISKPYIRRLSDGMGPHSRGVVNASPGLSGADAAGMLRACIALASISQSRHV